MGDNSTFWDALWVRSWFGINTIRKTQYIIIGGQKPPHTKCYTVDISWRLKPPLFVIFFLSLNFMAAYTANTYIYLFIYLFSKQNRECTMWVKTLHKVRNIYVSLPSSEQNTVITKLGLNFIELFRRFRITAK
jgi:hypothetical protein